LVDLAFPASASYVPGKPGVCGLAGQDGEEVAGSWLRQMDPRNTGPTGPKPDEGGPDNSHAGRRTISVMGREFTMPRSRRMRVAIGVVLVILGMFGFLPVLGFWMIPVGILVLSYEFASLRRFRRRFEIWWAERRGRRRARRR